MTHTRHIRTYFAASILAAAILLGFMAAPHAALAAHPKPSPWDVTGVWESQFFTMKLEAHLEQGKETVHKGLANRLSGVIYSISPSGKKTTYHIAGLVFGDTITGIHGSGHSFKGEITDNGNRIEGVLTLSSGQELPLCATRRGDSE